MTVEINEMLFEVSERADKWVLYKAGDKLKINLEFLKSDYPTLEDVARCVKEGQ